MDIKTCKDFLQSICNLVKKNNHINVNLIDITFYGVHKYSDENIYKVTFRDDNKEMTIYVEESAFKYGGTVPWSGQRNFRPDNGDAGPEDQKLTLAWCGCIYMYCIHGNERLDNKPPIIE